MFHIVLLFFFGFYKLHDIQAILGCSGPGTFGYLFKTELATVSQTFSMKRDGGVSVNFIIYNRKRGEGW